MRFLFSLPFIILLVPCFAFAEDNKAAADCSLARTAFAVAGKLRNLKQKFDVPCKIKSRQEIENYIRDALRKKVAPDKIKNEGKVYELLGLIPQDYDYENNLIALYSQEVGGFYDPEQKFYAMADWLNPVMQMNIAVHELTHALQDQHFNLEKMVNPTSMSSDMLLARSALAEGDASMVMLDYGRSLQDKASLISNTQDADLAVAAFVAGMLASQPNVGPKSLRSIIIFPYVGGLGFVANALKKGGIKEVDRIFSHPPRTTEEILHPEVYYSAKDSFELLDDPKLDISDSNYKMIFSDSLGEFVVSVLLENWLSSSEATVAARGWAGDRLVLFDGQNGTGKIVLWQIRWDSEKDKQEFIEAFKKAYSRRLEKQPEIDSVEKLVWQNTKLGSISVQTNDLDALLRIEELH